MATELGRSCDCRPASIDKLAPHRLERFRRDDTPIDKGGPNLIADLIRRSENLGEEPCGFLKHTSDHFRIDMVEVRQGNDGWNVCNRVQGEGDISDGGCVIRHAEKGRR